MIAISPQSPGFDRSRSVCSDIFDATVLIAKRLINIDAQKR